MLSLGVQVVKAKTTLINFNHFCIISFAMFKQPTKSFVLLLGHFSPGNWGFLLSRRVGGFAGWQTGRHRPSGKFRNCPETRSSTHLWPFYGGYCCPLPRHHTSHNFFPVLTPFLTLTWSFPSRLTSSFASTFLLICLFIVVSLAFIVCTLSFLLLPRLFHCWCILLTPLVTTLNFYFPLLNSFLFCPFLLAYCYCEAKLLCIISLSHLFVI